MSWVTDFFTSSTSGVVDSIGKAIDDNVTSDEERLILKNALTKIKSDAEAKLGDLELKLEQEVTERHKTDMNSDNKLSKNIRPMALIYLLGFVTVIAVFDGNIGEFSVSSEYITLFQALLTVAFGFYFTSRGIEKAVKAWKNKE